MLTFLTWGKFYVRESAKCICIKFLGRFYLLLFRLVDENRLLASISRLQK